MNIVFVLNILSKLFILCVFSILILVNYEYNEAGIKRRGSESAFYLKVLLGLLV
jgi:hypothetical protein